MTRLFTITALFFLHTPGIAKSLPPGHSPCSWKCKSIPPLEDSLLRTGSPVRSYLPAKNLNLLVWNVYKGRKSDFSDEFGRLSKNKSLMILQEVALDKRFRKVKDAFESNHLHVHGVSFLMKRSAPTGVSTLSESSSLGSSIYRTTDREPFSKTPKVTLLSYYAIENQTQTLLVINIHGINFKGLTGLTNQMEQIEAELSFHKGPVIFAGDFNTKDNERLDYVDNFLSRFQLKRLHFSNDNRKKKLDVVYYRSIKINRAHLDTETPGSDHPAIDINFDF